MIILKNIYKKYRSKKYVLRNINLNLPDKGFISIIGDSGSGKTTLLNLIGGLDEPTKGEIYIDRVHINKLKDDKTLYTKYISFIFQNYNLIDNLSIKDNISMINNKNCDNLLRKMRLLSKKNTIVNELSGGMKQRVAIARALAHDKKIIICDEPTGALDSKNSKIIMDILKKISKDKLIIMVTHNTELANTYSDRIITIKDGQLENDTSPLDLNERTSTYKKTKSKISIKTLIQISFKNYKRNKKRNIMTIIALSVGLISLLSVMALSNGFNKSLEYEEKNSLASYPILISETSTDLSNDLKDIFKEEITYKDGINSIEESHKNKIDKTLISYIDNNKYTKYILKKYLINDIYLSYIDKYIENELDFKYGNIPSNNKELLLLISDNNTINNELLKQLNLNKNYYTYEEITKERIRINNSTYKISGIATFKEASSLYGETGIILNEEPKIIPLEIYLYPKDYNNKLSLINYLNNYKDLEYTDYSNTVKEITNKAVDAISIVLIIFSLITLLVASIMLYILTLITVIERTREIGIYKVNGMSSFNIKFIIYLENIYITLISIISSILLLNILSIPLNTIFESLTGLKNIIDLSTNNIKTAISIILSIVTLSTLIPLKRIDKMNLIDTNRNI